MKLNDNIRTLRQKKGVSQETLASYLNVTPQAVSRWESGKTMPDIALLPSLAFYFEVTTDTLLGYDPSETTRNQLTAALSYAMGHEPTDSVLAKCRDALALYPSDMAITLLTATAITTKVIQTKEEHLRQPLYEEGLRLCRRVLDDDRFAEHADMIRASAKLLMVQLHRAVGNTDAALEIAAFLPIFTATQDYNLLPLLSGDALKTHLARSFVQMTGYFAQIPRAGSPMPLDEMPAPYPTADYEHLIAALAALYALSPLVDVRTNLHYFVLLVTCAKQLCEDGRMDDAVARLSDAADCLPHLENAALLHILPTRDGWLSVTPGDACRTPAAYLAHALESDPLTALPQAARDAIEAAVEVWMG